MVNQALREVESPGEVAGILMETGDQKAGECAGGDADEGCD
jgi:hypothetical protein